MLRKLAVLTVALTLCAAFGVMAGEDKTKGKATVEPISLSVSRKSENKNIMYSPNVAVTAVVSCPGKQILAIDSPNSKISAFGDDKKTDFLKASGFFRPSAQFQQNTVAKDFSAVVVNAHSFSHAPAKGASKILLKGTVTLICGVEDKSSEEKEVEMKLNSTATFGDFTLKVMREKGFGSEGAEFSITSKKRTFKSVTVKDADGKAVTVRPGFFPSINPFDKTVSHSFTLSKPMPKAKIVVNYFAKEETVKVPVDLSVGVGL